MLNIVPRMHDNVVVINEGDIFGPYNCSVDCNPPCVVSWAFLNSNESVSIETQGGDLQPQTVNRNLTLVKCAAKWGTNIFKENGFRLNIQCKYLILFKIVFEESDIYINIDIYIYIFFHK